MRETLRAPALAGSRPPMASTPEVTQPLSACRPALLVPHPPSALQHSRRLSRGPLQGGCGQGGQAGSGAACAVGVQALEVNDGAVRRLVLRDRHKQRAALLHVHKHMRARG